MPILLPSGDKGGYSMRRLPVLHLQAIHRPSLMMATRYCPAKTWDYPPQPVHSPPKHTQFWCQDHCIEFLAH